MPTKFQLTTILNFFLGCPILSDTFGDLACFLLRESCINGCTGCLFHVGKNKTSIPTGAGTPVTQKKSYWSQISRIFPNRDDPVQVFDRVLQYIVKL